MTTHLSSGKINIGQIQETARNKLISLLEKYESPKALVWDETLAGPVGLIIEYKLLKEHNVEKVFALKPNVLPHIDAKNIIFILRPSLSLMDVVADFVHKTCQEEKGREVRKEFHLFFVPRTSLLCEKHLKNRGVYGNFTIEEFNCELFPFDNDLMSMEIENAFKELTIENDPSCLYQVSQALMTIQKEFGIIPRVSGKGHAAKVVWDLMNKMRRVQTSRGEMKAVNQSPQIDHLLLIDRSIDLISPLATQLTYEGLIDELFGIKNTTAEFPAERFLKPDHEPEVLTSSKKLIILNSSDELYSDLRDKNFNAVGPILSKKAKQMAQFELDLKSDASPGLEEMKKIVKSVPFWQNCKRLLALHTTIAELIKEKTDNSDFLDSLQVEQELLNGVETDKIHPFIEDCIAKKESLFQVLRLLCLQSLANSGLKPKVLEHYKREILQSYGFHHILTLSNLEKCGLLQIQHSSRAYTVLRRTFRLTVEDGSEIDPTDVSYVHSVYAPLTSRLAENLAKSTGWKALHDVLGLMPGPTVEETQVLTSAFSKKGFKDSAGTQATADNPKVILVFFIGGCTFAEVSALRFLSQQEDLNVEFVVATTKLISGNTFLKSLMEELRRES